MPSTRSRVMTLLFFWFAVTLTILSTACSRNSGGGGQPAPAPAPTATPAGPKVTRTVPTRPAPEAEAPVPQVPAPAPNLETKAPERKTVVHDPTGLTAEQVYQESSKFTPPREGNVPSDIKDRNGNRLVYSGAGVDDLREKLHQKVDGSGDEQTRALDRRYAAGVSLATYEVDWASRRVRASVHVKRDGELVAFDFFGRLDSNRRFRAGDTSVYPFIEAEMVCLDGQINNCETAHIRVRDGFDKQLRTAHILVRQTSSNIHFAGPGFGLAKNPEYDRLLNVMINTQKKAEGLNHIEDIRYVTSETINGPSIFFVTIKMLMAEGWPTRAVSEQYLAFMGPLVKPQGWGTDLDHQIQLLPAVISLEGERLLCNPLISDTISHIRLIKNDGRGNPTFALTIRKNEWGSREETMHLTLLRKTPRVGDSELE